MATRLFAPKSYSVRTAFDTAKKHGATINPPRFPEIGGANKNNVQRTQSSLTLKKPGGTK